MYASILCDVTEVQDMLNQINEDGSEIIQMIYVTDSQQILIVYENGEENKRHGWLIPKNENT